MYKYTNPKNKTNHTQQPILNNRMENYRYLIVK
jgi:hypothetical protein